MKILVASYSRTGKTKKLAGKIAPVLSADTDEIIDKKKRKGVLGFIIGGFDALKEKLTDIEISENPADYDIVVIGTPVWAGNVTPAVRRYLTDNKLKSAAFFATSGSGREDKTFVSMAKLAGTPLASLSVSARNIDSSPEEIEEFCSVIKNSQIT
ncbi:MAG: flavodoxin [Elusimicrobia bacterium]|nr:flavodoxin [Elusimicrobiota bacterium]